MTKDKPMSCKFCSADIAGGDQHFGWCPTISSEPRRMFDEADWVDWEHWRDVAEMEGSIAARTQAGKGEG